MSSNRYLFPDYNIVSEKRSQKKILRGLFIAIIIAVLGIGILTYLSTTEALLGTKKYYDGQTQECFANKKEGIASKTDKSIVIGYVFKNELRAIPAKIL